MRVIAGKAKGRRLKTREGLEVRPTPEKVKEAIFSSIQFSLQDAVVLDLFAGSGQLGIEALSRGASKAVFVDQSAESLAFVSENLETVGMTDQSLCVCKDAVSFFSNTTEIFDIALLDPPYRQGTLAMILPILSEHMKDDGIVICEHETGLVMPEKVASLVQQRQKKYGSVTVTTYHCTRREA